MTDNKISERLSLEEADKRINDPDVVFSINEGLSFNMVCSSAESLLSFIRKFDDIEPWVQAGVAEGFVHDETIEHMVEEYGEDDEENELINKIPIPIEQKAIVCSYNQFRPQGQEFLFQTRTIKKLDPNDIRLAQEYQYPVFVHYRYDTGYDRAGNFEYNGIFVTELPKLGLDKICIW